jgi:hypothetical protein
MKNVTVFLLAGLLAGCASQFDTTGATGAQGVAGPAGPQGPAAPVPPAPDATQQLINNENSYRRLLGQAPFTQGLACTVQAIASGQYLSSASPGYTAAQAIITTGSAYSYLLLTAIDQPNSNPGPNNLIDPDLQPLFLSNNYKIVCTGQLVVTQTSDDYHTFTMSSDDGSILTIDGTVVISNDGSHGISTVNGTKALDPDVVHSFSIQYAQSGAGQFALVLDMDGALLPASQLFH